MYSEKRLKGLESWRCHRVSVSRETCQASCPTTMVSTKRGPMSCIKQWSADKRANVGSTTVNAEPTMPSNHSKGQPSMLSHNCGVNPKWAYELHPSKFQSCHMLKFPHYRYKSFVGFLVHAFSYAKLYHVDVIQCGTLPAPSGALICPIFCGGILIVPELII